MNCVKTLQWAHEAGLTVEAAEDRLVVRGPRSAEPIARHLLAHKADVLFQLRVEALPPDRRSEFEERAAIREYEGGQCREAAELDAIHEIRARMRAAGEYP